MIWFEKNPSELKGNQNEPLETMWEYSVHLLARCVWGVSKYRKKVVFSGPLENLRSQLVASS